MTDRIERALLAGEDDKKYRVIIYGIVINGMCPSKDFIDSLEKKEKRKIASLLEFSAFNGTPRNIEKFKQLKKVGNVTVFEFKADSIRLLCARDGDEIIILTHGFKKKKQKTPKGEIERAVRLLKLYYEVFPR